MLIEQLIFAVIAIMLFIVLFVKMIKHNDTSYVIIFFIQAIGIIIDIIEVLFIKDILILLKIIKYILGLFIPIIILTIEKRGHTFLELKNIFIAKMQLSRGNTKAAKDALIEIASKYPNNYSAHKMLAEIYEGEGGLRKAIDEYVQAVDINKQDYDSYYKIASLLTQFDKKDEAREMLTNLVQKKPDYVKGAELLGELLIENEMYKEAVSVYTEALKHNPGSFELNYNIGIAFTMLNDFKSAKLYFEKAAELNSLAYNTHYSLAEIAMIYKELDEAEKHFLEVLEEENCELEADAYYELAKINIIRGERERAIQYANIAIEVDSKKIVPKIKSEDVFIPILGKINIPFNLVSLNDEKAKTKLTKKELKAKEHLEEMVDKTRTLGYNDIDRLKKENKAKSNIVEASLDTHNRERDE